jgi:signal transduction histidine kinase
MACGFLVRAEPWVIRLFRLSQVIGCAPLVLSGRGRTFPLVLREFIKTNREEILTAARARVALRSAPLPPGAELEHGLPVFLDQLGDALRRATAHEVVDHADITSTAGRHGDHLFRHGMTVAQVVNSYGDLCQVITGLVISLHAGISPAEFQTLNLCLDDATAGAVTAYSSQREHAITGEETERLGVLAHELRNALNSAMLSFDAIKRGAVATSGSTSAMLDRSLARLHRLIDGSLAEVRLDAGLVNVVPTLIWEVIEEAEIGATMMAHAKGLRVAVAPVDHSLLVMVDRPVLAAAIANLLQNALKFTHKESTVTLRAVSTDARVRIEVEDECGGLPPGATTSLLAPFAQKGQDRSGLGLGLSICVRTVELMNGELHIQDLPGQGCIFAIDLPRHRPAPTMRAVH